MARLSGYCESRPERELYSVPVFWPDLVVWPDYRDAVKVDPRENYATSPFSGQTSAYGQIIGIL